MGFNVGQPVGEGAKNQLNGQLIVATATVPTKNVVGNKIGVGETIGTKVGVMLGV
jgi:hypothetical protein